MARIVLRGGPGPDRFTSPDDLSGDRYFLAGLGGDDTLGGLGSGNDTLVGGKGMDSLRAGRGSDQVLGGEGADRIFVEATASDGLDYASGGSGRDWIDLLLGLGDVFSTDAGRSFDTITGGGGSDLLKLREDPTEFTSHVRGTRGWRIDLEKQRIFDPVLGYDVAQIKRIETVAATVSDDTLKGWFNDEFLYGSTGSDLIQGGEGDDTLSGGLGQDTLEGGDGRDLLVSGFDLNPRPDRSSTFTDLLGPDILRGGKGADWLVSIGQSSLYGDGGDDQLYVAPYPYLGKQAKLFGGPGRDTLHFGAVDNEGRLLGNYARIQDFNMHDAVVDGGRGASDTAEFSRVYNANGALRLLDVDLALDSATLTGGLSTVTLTRIENVRGTNYWDKIDGDNGQNVLEGNDGNDTLRGFGGADVISGAGGEDSIEGGAGDDTLRGGDEVDVIRGAGDDDAISGGSGSDRLFGGSGNDTIHGGSGNDTIDLGAFERGGRQEASGAKGEDTFVLNRNIGEVRIFYFDAKGRVHDFLDLRPMGGVTVDSLDILPYDEGLGVGIFLEGTSFAIDLPGVALRHLDVGDFIV